MSIKILPEHVARRIRAGEVVERPAAAVRELVDNALDAGARAIRVVADRGGLELLLVEDDGCGMDRRDLELCTLPHATSKIATEDDLSRIATYGFRGEALAALAAVSELTVSSRPRGAEMGWTIVPGGAGEASPCSLPAGTTQVEARNLFASHPARLAFLRPPRTELAAIRTVIEDAALASPGTGFTLRSGGRTVLSLQPSNLDERLALIAGPGFSQNSVQLAGRAGSLGVSGIVGVPGWRGHGSAGQRFFVNGRRVADRVMAGALRSAFSDLSGVSSPACLILLDLPASEVDVNVHPAKSEIRFRSPDTIHHFLRGSIRQALSGNAGMAAADMSAAATRAAVPLQLGAEADRSGLPLGRALGVVMGGYAVCYSQGAGLVVIDLHAAAERAAYERLLVDSVDHGVAFRSVLPPLMLEVGSQGCAAAEQHSAALERAGFQIHSLDDTALSVAAVPSFLPDHLISSVVQDVVARLVEDGHAGAAEDVTRQVCARLACHAAFRFGDDISLEELDTRLREFERTPNVSTCMHGRPVFMAWNRHGLDGLFERR